MRNMLIAVSLLAIPSMLLAGPAADQLGSAAGANASISQQIEKAEGRLRVTAGRTPTIPQKPRDVFAECSGIDVLFNHQPLLSSTVRDVQRCLDMSYKPAPNERSERRTFGVQASAGAVECGPGSPRTAHCKGVVVTISGFIAVGNNVRHDLQFTLGKRGWKIHGHTSRLQDDTVVPAGAQQ